LRRQLSLVSGRAADRVNRARARSIRPTSSSSSPIRSRQTRLQ
jgi:hypothetical protein